MLAVEGRECVEWEDDGIGHTEENVSIFGPGVGLIDGDGHAGEMFLEEVGDLGLEAGSIAEVTHDIMLAFAEYDVEFGCAGLGALFDDVLGDDFRAHLGFGREWVGLKADRVEFLGAGEGGESGPATCGRDDGDGGEVRVGIHFVGPTIRYP